MDVLVVDDSTPVRERLVDMLHDIPGVSAWEATNAQEALEVLDARVPRAVLLDVSMPGESGLSIVARIKATHPAPVVVLLTNWPTEHHRREAVRLGADHFFDKSKDFSRACDVVRALAEEAGH
jgi:CheY-like chemotaxis protein